MRYIISLGGSLIAPRGIDFRFLKKFRKVLLNAAKKGDKFFIIPGGGQTCRSYQDAARKLAHPTNRELDWIGIAVNKLHSTFLHTIFGKAAHSEIAGLNSKAPKVNKSIVIAVGGLKPGGTSDSTAVKFAAKFGTKTIINLTNVSGVYDRDPRKFKNAKLIRKMSWTDLKSQFGVHKTPGRNQPFDGSIASQAGKLKLTVVILSGRNLNNFQNFLAGKKFKGTMIT